MLFTLCCNSTKCFALKIYEAVGLCSVVPINYLSSTGWFTRGVREIMKYWIRRICTRLLDTHATAGWACLIRILYYIIICIKTGKGEALRHNIGNRCQKRDNIRPRKVASCNWTVKMRDSDSPKYILTLILMNVPSRYLSHRRIPVFPLRNQSRMHRAMTRCQNWLGFENRLASVLFCYCWCI